MQHKNSFDKESLVKMLKGALIAGTAAAALFSLDMLGTMELENPILAMLVASGVPTLVNVVKEFHKGE
jgi:hypothetical protein